VTMHQTTNSPVLDVTRPAGVSGPLLRLSYAACSGEDVGGGPLFAYSYTWIKSGLHVTPGCFPVTEWHVRLGWLNRPVASLDYTAPESDAAAPTPLPAPRPMSARTWRV
jgi:hypothetical protein